MADDDAKGGAKGKTPRAGAGRAKSAAAGARAAKSQVPKTAAKPAPDDVTETTAKDAAKRPLPLGLLGLAAVIITLAVMVLAWPAARDRFAALLPGPKAPPPVAVAAGAEIASLADRLARLEKSLSGLGKDIADLKSVPQGRSGAGLDGSIKTLESRLAVVEARLSAGGDGGASLAAIEERLSGLAKTLAAMEARIGQMDVARGMTGTMALMALTNALRAGVPFKGFLVSARAATAGPDGAGIGGRLDAIGVYAENGVPVRTILSTRFAALPRGARKPPANADTKAAPAGGGLWDRVTARLKGLVKIRKIDGADSRAAQSASWQAAETAMVAGDLAAATAAIDGIADGRVAAWRRDAKARLNADRIANALDALTAARLGPRPEKR
jgi:hypothetical protein